MVTDLLKNIISAPFSLNKEAFECLQIIELWMWMTVLFTRVLMLKIIFVRLHTSKTGKLYLHTDIRLIFSRDKFEFDPTVATYELRSFVDPPPEPRYSPKNWNCRLTNKKSRCIKRQASNLWYFHLCISRCLFLYRILFCRVNLFVLDGCCV